MLTKEQVIAAAENLIGQLTERIEAISGKDQYRFEVYYQEYAPLLREIKFFFALYDETKVYLNDCQRTENFQGVYDPAGRKDRRYILLDGYRKLVTEFRDVVKRYV